MGTQESSDLMGEQYYYLATHIALCQNVIVIEPVRAGVQPSKCRVYSQWPMPRTENKKQSFARDVNKDHNREILNLVGSLS